MSYDEGLAERLRDLMAELEDTEEKRMFGGLALMWRGHMLCGVVQDAMIARVGKPGYEAALALEGARPFDFTGKPLTGFVCVASEAIAEDEALQAWFDRCCAFVLQLEPK